VRLPQNAAVNCMVAAMLAESGAFEQGCMHARQRLEGLRGCPPIRLARSLVSGPGSLASENTKKNPN